MLTPLQIINRIVSAIALLVLGAILAISKGSWDPIVITLVVAVWVLAKGG